MRPIGVFLRRTAAAAGWRVVIVDGADRLNRNAANALLKLLEEPPERALLLLVCEAPGRLLATIRSRCRALRLSPIDDASMRTVLQRLRPELSEPERETLLALGRGSPGRALSLAAGDGLVLSGLVRDLLRQPDLAGDLRAYDLADTVLRHESGVSTFLGLLSAAISSTIRREVIAGRADPPAGLISSRPAARWAEICASLVRLRDETESLNLDKRQAVLAGLSLLSG